MTEGEDMPTNMGQQSSENANPNINHGEDQQTNPKSSRGNGRGRISAGTQPFSWEGQNKEIGVILGLRPERFQHKVVYSEFIEKVTNYVLQQFNYARDMIPILDSLEEPKRSIIKQHNEAMASDISNIVQNTTTEEVEGGVQIKTEGGRDSDSEESVKQPSQSVVNLITAMNDEVLKWTRQERIKKHITRLTQLENNKERLYGIIRGQCTIGLQEVIKGHSEYREQSIDFNCIWLLQKLKLASSGMDARANKYFTLVMAMRYAFTVRQRNNETNDSYRVRLESQLMLLKLAGGKHALHSPDMIQKSAIGILGQDDIKAEEEKMKAMILILGADPDRFGHLQSSLEEGVMLGRDEYPTTMVLAYELLQKTAPTLTNPLSRFSKFRRSRNGRGQSRVSFMQKGATPVPGVDGKVHTHITCHKCKHDGHYKNQCPDIEGSDNVSFPNFSLSQHELATINPNWILLDTCSTVSVFNNAALVHDISYTSDPMMIVTNGGTESFPQTAIANMLPIPVHFNEQSLANIFSLKDVADLEGARLTMDTSVSRAINLHYGNNCYLFRECCEGLYYYDVSTGTTSQHNIKPKSVVNDNITCVQTVQENKLQYSKKDIAAADLSHTLQAELGWPSTSTFKSIVAKNLIRNCPVTVDDISRADNIYGPPPPILQGKATRTTPSKPSVPFVPLPLQIQEHYRDVTLYIDFFYVNGLPFLHTKSKDIHFLTVQCGHTRNTTNIIKGLQKVFQTYHRRGFNMVAVHGDNEFNIPRLLDTFLPIVFHIYAAGEHCGPIERSTRTVKEKCRCITHSLPFLQYTKLMVYGLVESAIYWTNAFPTKNSASDTLSASSIVIGRASPDGSKPRIAFGSYALVFARSTNTMAARKIPCIALNPSNEWGGYYFMSLYTGKRIHSYAWTVLPITDDVVARVHELASLEKQPLIKKGQPFFEWNPGIPIADDPIDLSDEVSLDYHPPTYYYPEHLTPPTEDFDDLASLQSEERDNDPLEPLQREERTDHQHFDEITAHNSSPNELSQDTVTYSTHSAQATTNSPMNAVIPDDDESSIPPEHDPGGDNLTELQQYTADAERVLQQEIDSINQLMEEPASSNIESISHSDEDEGLGSTTNPEGLRRSTRRNAGTGVDSLFLDNQGKSYTKYKYLQFLQTKRIQRSKKSTQIILLQKKQQATSTLHRILNFVFAQQMSAKKGIKKFGERAIAALVKEFTQLDKGAVPGKPVVEGVDPGSIKSEERKKILEAVNLIAEKRSGLIKGRTCADGSRQRRYLNPNESVASPTVSLEALLSTLVVDAYERRHVAIFDVPGAYLHAEMPRDKRVIMRLRGQFVDIMVQVNPVYSKFVTYENGQKVL